MRDVRDDGLGSRPGRARARVLSAQRTAGRRRKRAPRSRVSRSRCPRGTMPRRLPGGGTSVGAGQDGRSRNAVKEARRGNAVLAAARLGSRSARLSGRRGTCVLRAQALALNAADAQRSRAPRLKTAHAQPIQPWHQTSSVRVLRSGQGRRGLPPADEFLKRVQGPAPGGGTGQPRTCGLRRPWLGSATAAAAASCSADTDHSANGSGAAL